MGFEETLMGLGVTVIINLCGSVWWAGNMNARVKSIEEKISQVQLLPERMARLETVVQTLVQTSQNTGASVAVIKDFLIQAETQRLKQAAVEANASSGALTG